MKHKIFFAILALVFAGCGPEGDNNNDQDSLMTDSAVMDTVDMKAIPGDTTASRRDSINTDTAWSAINLS